MNNDYKYIIIIIRCQLLQYMQYTFKQYEKFIFEVVVFMKIKSE